VAVKNNSAEMFFPGDSARPIVLGLFGVQAIKIVMEVKNTKSSLKCFMFIYFLIVQK